MAIPFAQCVDTVIVGNGPSALVLSYILHGHIPYYLGRHQDNILDAKLSDAPCLLNITPHLYAHFLSSLRYSTQALPVNTLLDTLIRPNADTEVNPKSCIEWRYEPEKAISHVAIGETAEAGGQWADNPVSASADIGTLSYAEQLSLPGYSYAEHQARSQKEDQCDFVRPTRTEVAEYLRAYPHAVGISDAICTDTKVADVRRTVDGFVIGSLGIHCKHLVLASGIFTVNIPPPPLLAPISQFEALKEPLLVIGSGFSAADVIISTPPGRKIIHIFQWAPDTRPSPLKGCHKTAYPEYATVYRQMKLAAISSSRNAPVKSPLLRRKSNPFVSQRNWTSQYEGYPNAEVIDVSATNEDGSSSVTIRLASGEHITRCVGGLEYLVGRRGSLDYLSPDLLFEVAGTIDATQPTLISGQTLRAKAESSLEVAKNVLIIGSLTGDSLIRHAIGGCVFAAGRTLGAIESTYSPLVSPSRTSSKPSSRPLSPTSLSESTSNTSTSPPIKPRSMQEKDTPGIITNGHADLHLDRRKLARAVDFANAENRYWVESGWWAGGLGPSALDCDV